MFDETYDKHKSSWTGKVRGIDFIEARAVWDDLDAIDGPADMKDGEERWLKVGRIDNKVWTVGFTIRPAGIRIFMVRAARKDEKDVYNGY